MLNAGCAAHFACPAGPERQYTRLKSLMTSLPVIGVTSRRGDAEWIAENTVHYLNTLRELGATPVVIAPDRPAVLPDGTAFTPDAQGRVDGALLDRLDGLILAGGGDVHPRYFGAELNGANPDAIDLKRDELELGLARRALALDLPLFGICRGFQVMNVAAGGGMVQDFGGHRSPKEAPFFHDVVLRPGSRIRAIAGVETLSVNTYHHQGVDGETLAPGLVNGGAARPDAWLIEAIESPNHRWVMGVQWHPERLFELPAPHRRLWESFLDASRSGAG